MNKNLKGIFFYTAHFAALMAMIFGIAADDTNDTLAIHTAMAYAAVSIVLFGLYIEVTYVCE